MGVHLLSALPAGNLIYVQMFVVREVHTNLFLYRCIYYQGVQSRDFQPTLHKTAQSCAWQQKALWRSWPKSLHKFPYASPYPSSKCLYTGAHISASTHVIAEPEEGAGIGWGPSLGARVKCKHLTSQCKHLISHMGEGETGSQYRAKELSLCCHRRWDLTPPPATCGIDPLVLNPRWCTEDCSQRGTLFI